MKTIGLTIGKFMPLHKGHELLLRIAASNVDMLYILIGETENDPFPVEQRVEWIHEALEGFYHGYNSGYHILVQKEPERHPEKDINGTVTDENYWQWWLKDTRELIANTHTGDIITHVFTSDLYGERIAREFEAKWIPVDPDREMIAISGTKVRNDFYSNFHLLPQYVKRDLAKVVAIVGPESCGKSTMITKLSQHFDTIPEYGRILSVNRKNVLDMDDFYTIQTTQNLLIDELKKNANFPVIVTDTEALVTALYADIWFPIDDTAPLYDYAEAQKIDHYIVLAPTVPWIQDGFRVMEHDAERLVFFDEIIRHLKKWNKNYTVIDDSDYSTRYWKAKQIIEGIIPKPKY